MTSTVEFAHQPDPQAIAAFICQELQSFDIDRLGVEVEIVDSNLDLQIRADSSIDKEKLLAIVRRELQNLHIKSVAKFRIHCWRNDQEMHEQRLLWTEQFMLDLPTATNPLSPNSDLDDRQSAQSVLPNARSVEPQLSKHSVLQAALQKISPSSVQSPKDLLGNDQNQNQNQNQNHESASVANAIRPKSRSIVTPSRILLLSQEYWHLMLVGLSIILLGLGIGALAKAITSPNITQPNSNAIETAPKITAPISPKTESPNVSELIGKDLNPQPETRTVTLEKFNQIQQGMTVGQVEKILGESGKIIAKNISSNGVGEVYSWKNPQGSNAIIEFRDGKVVAKAQAGL
jgi:hypothetical protein